MRGGILKYLEEVPEENSNWEGECFVFDERISVDHKLNAGSYTLCTTCGDPMPNPFSERTDDKLYCEKCSE